MGHIRKFNESSNYTDNITSIMGTRTVQENLQKSIKTYKKI